jgi:hypothetical protein
MCKYVISLIDIQTLTDQQKNKLKRELQRYERNLQTTLDELSRAVKLIETKSRRKLTKRG